MRASALAPIEVPSEDRNRTSPFPYGGSRFEFRSVGSSQNVSLVNTVLAAITADAFRGFSDAIENGAKPVDVAVQALNDSWKVIFNGNGYDPANQKMLTENGLWRFDSCVDAICRITEPKNVNLFSSLGILTHQECSARQLVMLNQYINTVEMEALTMIDMINQYIIPAVKNGGVGPLEALQQDVGILKSAVADLHHASDPVEKATLARILRLETMINIRKDCDEAEAVVPAALWTLGTYTELLFMDQTA